MLLKQFIKWFLRVEVKDIFTHSLKESVEEIRQLKNKVQLSSSDICHFSIFWILQILFVVIVILAICS